MAVVTVPPTVIPLSTVNAKTNNLLTMIGRLWLVAVRIQVVLKHLFKQRVSNDIFYSTVMASALNDGELWGFGYSNEKWNYLFCLMFDMTIAELKTQMQQELLHFTPVPQSRMARYLNDLLEEK